MNGITSIGIRLLLILALLLGASVAFAQDEAASSDIPFIGIRYIGVDEGLFVTGVIPNTPAQAAELLAGDVVEAVNGEPIRVESVRAVVWKHAPGTTVTLSLERDGAFLDQDLTLMALPADLFENPDYAMPLDLAAIGLYVGQCDDKLLVLGALDGANVATAGFQLYDEIIALNGERVETIGEADAAVSRLSVGDALSFTLLRGDSETVITVEAEDQRRRKPRQRPPRRPHPRVEIERVYATDQIELGYGDGVVLIQALQPEHELYALGLRADDWITLANGAPVEEAEALFGGDTIALTVERESGVLQVDVPASVAPLLLFGEVEPVEQNRGQWLDLHEKQVSLGVRYYQLEADSPYLADTSLDHGALVAEVIEGLPAEAAGIAEGDIIVAVAGEPVTLEIDLRNRIYFHEPGEQVALLVLRDGDMLRFHVTLRAPGK